ncbi:thioesterase domain-containing protein [Xanthovirga aplysinae]|uniref:thioesterase domain-containing protein n=1 Tax=Xanthovirga aplysinae TaxID=2529853 RepID=UPI0012BB6085|nr:alpha/beta hydrolase [Xanthovirga aplysinae]MTI33587.1 alpha/beta hydrolase [Xanthovirga aplysinae]
MKIYAISGLGADERVFQYLDLKYEIIPIQWITPKSNESLAAYAHRLSEQIDQSKPYYLLGVSFGGMLATEMTKFLNPECCILISSAERSTDLPSFSKFLNPIKILNWIPSNFLKLPKPLMYWLFGTENKQLLGQILDDTDLDFVKWALIQILQWDKKEYFSNTLKIHGTSDKVIPVKNKTKTQLIPQGGHFMIIDKAKEISTLINEKLSSRKN